MAASLVIDSREPHVISQVLRGMVKPYKIDVATSALASADYLFIDCDGCRYGIERKTASDLLASLGKPRISDGVHRLQSQIDRMASDYDRHGLVIEGGFSVQNGSVSVKGRPSGWHHAAVQMFLFSFQARQGTFIHWTPDKGASMDLLRVLASRAARGCIFGADKSDPGNEAEAESST